MRYAPAGAAGRAGRASEARSPGAAAGGGAPGARRRWPRAGARSPDARSGSPRVAVARSPGARCGSLGVVVGASPGGRPSRGAAVGASPDACPSWGAVVGELPSARPSPGVALAGSRSPAAAAVGCAARATKPAQASARAGERRGVGPRMSGARTMASELPSHHEAARKGRGSAQETVDARHSTPEGHTPAAFRPQKRAAEEHSAGLLAHGSSSTGAFPRPWAAVVPSRGRRSRRRSQWREPRRSYTDFPLEPGWTLQPDRVLELAVRWQPRAGGRCKAARRRARLSTMRESVHAHVGAPAWPASAGFLRLRAS